MEPSGRRLTLKDTSTLDYTLLYEFLNWLVFPLKFNQPLLSTLKLEKYQSLELNSKILFTKELNCDFDQLSS